MPKVDLKNLPVYVEVGGQLVKVATGAWQAIKKQLASSPDITADNAQLDKIDAEYSERIERARDAANGVDEGGSER
jgi:predicted short-subunit dehydrogenase-like oxidoreductase (DUF2520 family)